MAKRRRAADQLDSPDALQQSEWVPITADDLDASDLLRRHRMNGEPFLVDVKMVVRPGAMVLRFPLFSNHVRALPGATPSECPRANPPLQVGILGKTLAESLAVIDRRYREVGLIPDGHAAHWVGAEVEGKLCQCTEHPDHPAGGSVVTVEPQGSQLAPLTEIQRKVLDYIAQHGPVMGKTIAAQFGMPLSSLTTHIIPVLKDSHGVINIPRQGYAVSRTAR